MFKFASLGQPLRFSFDFTSGGPPLLNDPISAPVFLDQLIEVDSTSATPESAPPKFTFCSVNKAKLSVRRNSDKVLNLFGSLSVGANPEDKTPGAQHMSEYKNNGKAAKCKGLRLAEITNQRKDYRQQQVDSHRQMDDGEDPKTQDC